jgi:phage terminase large subunit-like protein
VTDEHEEGPDPNDLRRHAKRMYTELQYRRKYRRIDFYKPNFKQLEFHNLMARERMLRAGNQLGKTHAVGAQMTMDALAMYPDWYQGRRFLKPPAITRPFDFLGWVGCTTSTTTRDGAQTKLLGDLNQHDGLGTGMIPLDNIVGKPTMARGISNFVDSVVLRRENGGSAVIRQKTFEMDRQAWQGEAVDVIWGDEDPKDDIIYGEALARLTTTKGQIIWSMTPVLGLTPVRKRYKMQHPGTAEVLMTIDDCVVSKGGHIPDEDLEMLKASPKENERDTRLYGADMQGEGAVFLTPKAAIIHDRDPAAVPMWWPWLWAVDFSHAGLSPTGHPFAAVLGTWDRDNDIIYVMHALRMRQSLAPNHVAAMKENPRWEAPVAWPHDGGRGASLVSGDTIAAVYRKLGLAMRQTHATFKTGGYSFEAGIKEMEERFGGGKLKIASHLGEVFDEYLGYHRDGGLVVKIDDDLLSAVRVLCMDIRNAKVPTEWGGYLRRSGLQGVAVGTEFDVFTGAAG